MSIRLYDEAIANKIQGWIKDKKIKVLHPDESGRLFGMLADQYDDKPLTLPIIALSRDSDVTLLTNSKKPLTFDGKMIDATNDYTYQLNAIQIKLGYNLDIYTRTAEEGDEYLRSLLFNLINKPKITIEIPYNKTHRSHNSYLEVNTTISDNSDIQQKQISDQFTRWTIGLTVKDAYLFGAPKYDVVSVEVEDVIDYDDYKIIEK